MVIDVIYGNDQEAKQAIHVYSEALKITQFDMVIKYPILKNKYSKLV